MLRIVGSYLPGFSSITIIVLLLGGIQLIAIGIIGEYVGRIYDEVKGRPLYLVRARRQLRTAVEPQPEDAAPTSSASYPPAGLGPRRELTAGSAGAPPALPVLAAVPLVDRPLERGDPAPRAP